MSLLLLKTRDLTWQDHTLNTEVMLAPARSGLLLNKHKTLGAKCHMDQQLYERQRAQCIKDFLSSRRLIERQRQKLIHRQRELGSKEKRVMSAAPVNPQHPEDEALTLAQKERSASAPGGLRAPVGLPAIYIDTGALSPDPSDSSSFFVTELSDIPLHSTPLPSFPSPNRISLTSSAINAQTAAARAQRNNRFSKRSRTPTRNKTPTNPSTPTRNKTPTGNPSPTREKTPDKIPPSFVRSQRSSSMFEATRPALFPEKTPTITKPSQSVRFVEQVKPEGSTHKESLKDHVLEAKVRAFIADIDEFTADCRLGKSDRTKRDESEVFPRTQIKTPVVAKRYSTWNLDQPALLSAFKQFCSVQSPEELARAMRMASKLKAKMKVTRNQSIIPSIATFKSTQAFKTLIKRNS